MTVNHLVEMKIHSEHISATHSTPIPDPELSGGTISQTWDVDGWHWLAGKDLLIEGWLTMRTNDQ